MSRLAAIRNAARSGLLGASIGAAGGGIAAGYSGGDIGKGMMGGAVAGGIGGGGMNIRHGMGLAGMKRSAQTASAKATQAQRVANNAGLFGFGARNRARNISNTAKDRSAGYGAAVSGRRTAGAFSGAVMGTGVGMGFAHLKSNGGTGLDVTQRNATLQQKLEFDRQKAMQRSGIKINEARILDEIRHPGAY